MLFPILMEGWVRKEMLSANSHQDIWILPSLFLCCQAILTLLLMLHECLTAVSSPHNSYITGGSSLLFFFEAKLQSWLMFAQKYVIVDFLLINRSRAQAAILPCYYYLCACRLEQGVLSRWGGEITLSLQERHWMPLIAAAATKANYLEALPVSFSVPRL